jgi:hypothetical protein
MEEFLSKIENFIFDILGLILPGFIFLSILIIPMSLIELKSLNTIELEKSYILSELSTIENLFNVYWDEKSNLVILCIVILAYLLGHFIKVFSIIKYEILVALFDKSLNKLMLWFIEIIKKGLRVIYNYFTNGDLYATSFWKWFKDFLKPLKNTFGKIFEFKSPNYFDANDSLKTECVSIINQRLNTTYPDNWYSVYKFSTVIIAQENIKSLSSFFLAKYNLYRSLAFIFLFSTFYYHFFFLASSSHLDSEVLKTKSLIIILSLLLWFTFHYKYKRYWTLCGNETLVSLFYFLNKKKINEA